MAPAQRAVSAAEFCEAVGIKSSELISLEAAGLPIAIKKEGRRELTVYPWPASIRWYIDHAVKTRESGIPPRVSQRDFATLVNRTTRQVSNLTADSTLTTIVEGGKRSYPLPLALHQFIEHAVATVSKRSEDMNDLDKARLRKTLAEAKQEELKLLHAEGEMLRSSLVRPSIEELLQAIGGFLKSVPARWSLHLVGMKSQAEARRALDKVSKEGLSELQKGTIQIAKRIQSIAATDEIEEDDGQARHVS